MNRIMLDLETLGNGSNAVITSIGAVEFIPEHGKIGQRFSIDVDPQSCKDLGLDMDVSAVLWWMKQSDKARAHFGRAKTSISTALLKFSKFVDNISPSNPEDVEIWGNGAAFDNVILSNAYKAAQVARPWSYSNDRCFRTLRAMYPNVPQDDIGISHCAVDDAEYQARLLMKIFCEMRGESQVRKTQRWGLKYWMESKQ